MYIQQVPDIYVTSTQVEVSPSLYKLLELSEL